MRIIFMGTPEFAVPTLAALHDAAHEIVAVYTQPPRPAGRGKKLQPSPVQREAEIRHLDVFSPVSLKLPAEQAKFAAFDADLAVVAAYGLILPQPILDAPRLGCLNVHASLLPRWRGAAPVQRAIEAGDSVTGVTIMQMEAGLDTGPMLATAATTITATDTAANLHDRLSTMGAQLLVETLARLECGAVTRQPQDNTLATYAAKLNKDEARLDWSGDADALARRIRAFNPWPVVHTTLDGKPLRLWLATASDATGPAQPPGTVLAADAGGIRVQCGQGALVITQLQAEGGRPLDARAFLNGRPLPPGSRLGA